MDVTTKITSLPLEILQDILLFIPVLKDLHQIIKSHPKFYAVFQDRRHFILATVFRRQVFGIGNWTTDCLGVYPATTNSMKRAKMAMNGLKMSTNGTNIYFDVDIATLYEALSPFYSPLLSSPSSRTSEWKHARIWAHSLIRSLAVIPSKSSIAISRGEDLWGVLIRRDVALAQEDFEMARTLIRLHRQENRPDDAFIFQEAVLDRLDPDSTEGSLWTTKLLEDYRSAGRNADGLALQMRLWDTARATRGLGSTKALEWARRVVQTYREMRLPAAAIEFQARVFELLEPRSCEYVAWGRGLIRMLKRAKAHADEILAVRVKVWRSYSPIVPGYHAWAGQMCLELRARKRETEAMGIEKDVWNAYKNDLLRVHACETVKTVYGRAAGASLARAYRRCGRVAAAERIETQLSKGRLKF